MTSYRVEIQGDVQDHEISHNALTDGLIGAGYVVGHSGDLADGGDRTLIWASAEDAEDDDGTNAVGEIRLR